MAGVVFTRVLYLFEDVCDRVWRGPEWLRPAVGGFLLGGLLLVLPQMYGVGYPVLGKSTTGTYTIAFLLMLLAGKMIATSLTIGIGGSGGVFAPSLFIGAMLGSADGQLSSFGSADLRPPTGSRPPGSTHTPRLRDSAPGRRRGLDNHYPESYAHDGEDLVPGMWLGCARATPAGVRPAMVGREHERAALAAALDDALHGRGRAAMLLGEAGMGKPTLADWLVAQGATSGMRIARASCSVAGMPPVWPWRLALQHRRGPGMAG